MTFDPVNKPSHYAEGRKYETIDVIEDWELSYRLGNAVKYISRAGRKNDAVEDLKKAEWYLQREIASLQGEPQTQYPSASEVQYDDVYEFFLDNVPFDGSDELDLWDPTLGPTEPDIAYEPVDRWGNPVHKRDYEGPLYAPHPQITETAHSQFVGDAEWDSEIDYATGFGKDLDQFDDEEIVRIIDRRGLIIGFKKDGSSCVLGKNGKCE